MSLEQELGLVKSTPIEMVYREPRADRLKQIPKTYQTPQLVEYVISNDGMALESVSKPLITYDLCKTAVQNAGLALRYVPSRYIRSEICDLAVSENGLALAFVPQEYITSTLAYKAVSFYYLYGYRKDSDDAIENGRKQGVKLGEYCKYPIAYVPPLLLTEELLLETVRYSPHSLRDVPRKLVKKEIALAAVSIDGTALRYIPKNLISKEIIETATLSNPFALEFIPTSKITEDICYKCFENNPLTIQYIPNEYMTATLCNTAFKRNPDCFKYIPEEYKTLEMCINVVQKENFGFSISHKHRITLLFDDIPQDKRNNEAILSAILERYEDGARYLLKWNEQINEKNESTVPLHEETVNYLNEKIKCYEKEQQDKFLSSKIGLEICKVQSTDYISLKVPLEPLASKSLPVEYGNDVSVIHNLADENVSAKTIYYVTDIHLEHQLKPIIEKTEQERRLGNERDLKLKFLSAVDNFLNEKIQELVSSAESTEGILLIGGDVASSKELAILFYKKLSSYWRGRILFILGNHELWDGNLSAVLNVNARTVDEIVNDYRGTINNHNDTRRERMYNVSLLENEIYIVYKNQSFNKRVIREDQILNASNSELADVCSKASTIILGGIGFSGLNQYYNAELGLYRATVSSLEHDRKLSDRFSKVYRKLNQCAGDKRVIVFTHTPVYDWTNEPCNPNWVYINGHTHHNNLKREENGAIILSDNQIGYNSQKWKLNAFTISGWYDPFEKYEDGIYEITSEQYKDFNVGRGIDSKGCNYHGKIYALKREDLYMFLLETSSGLCLLSGGQRKKLEHYDVKYYYDNMSLYGRIVCEAIRPYQQILQAISKEVKCFGGTGRIHGCIVDISWFSHIYVNPYDGKVTSYWALNTYSRIVFENIQMLLEEKEPLLFDRFILEQKRKMLPIIDKHIMKTPCNAEVAIIPQWVFGMEMYAPSRVMMSVQYIWSQNVIRVWNEDILNSYIYSREIEEKEASFLTE